MSFLILHILQARVDHLVPRVFLAVMEHLLDQRRLAGEHIPEPHGYSAKIFSSKSSVSLASKAKIRPTRLWSFLKRTLKGVQPERVSRAPRTALGRPAQSSALFRTLSDSSARASAFLCFSLSSFSNSGLRKEATPMPMLSCLLVISFSMGAERVRGVPPTLAFKPGTVASNPCGAPTRPCVIKLGGTVPTMGLLALLGLCPLTSCCGPPSSILCRPLGSRAGAP
ncbi:hypothetical protein J4Q44_G00330960 [Coregonus suidteri]|uniref:Uncharacterized protein n=1 Tax=Coregonus suidteri TaxID=861788 RepID=A0AAN8KX90_9TELE